MKTVDDYKNLITSEHQDKPNFMATVGFLVEPLVQLQKLMLSLNALFDIDTPPVGQQLDIIGKWVGVSREVAIPIFGVYFQWDAGADVGWDFGIWQPTTQPTALTVLPDDAYLTLIRARIAANSWDGTTEGAYKIWHLLFPDLNYLVQDNQDMSFAVAVQGHAINSLTLALLIQGYLPLKPEGIRINEYIIAVDTNPLFAWDVDSAYVQGWDLGSWGMELDPI